VVRREDGLGMSDSGGRRAAKTQRRWNDLLHMQEQQRLRAEDDSRRLRAQREELLRQWFCRHLQQTDPAPGQRPDTLLGDLIGDKSLLKRSKMASLSLPMTSLQPLSGGGWLLEARGAGGTSFRKAFRRLAKRALTQMSNRELPAAGAILDATIDAGGLATIVARIVDTIAAQKVKGNVYPLVEITHAAGEVLAVDLVDTALSKGASKGKVLAQLYKGEFMTSKKANKLARRLGVPVPTPTTIRKAVPPNSEAARTLIQAPLIPDAGDPQRRRLHQQAAVELIKASRRLGPITDPRLTMLAGLR
jgi:hypothetical protein